MNHDEPGSTLEHPLTPICVQRDTPLADVLRRQSTATEFGLPAGIALVIDEDRRLIGTVTDGDVRRALLRQLNLQMPAHEAMNPDPIAFVDEATFGDILDRLPGELERRGRRSSRFLGKVVLVDAKNRPTRVIDYHQLWEQRVATHRHIVVIGLGYVGLTLALALAEQGFRVMGIDADPRKVNHLDAGESHVHEVGLLELLREQLHRNFHVGSEIPSDGDVFVISVGTPVQAASPTAMPTPQLDFLREAAVRVAEKLPVGGLVVLRSTVPVGTCRELVLPLLEQHSGLKGGRDFHLAFAPERTIEGKALQELHTLPQIIGGLTADSVEATAALFRELTPTIVRVESLEAAEMVKLVNNSFRDLVFAFANEIARICMPHNIDAVEMIKAANQGYPRNPVPLPSPGVGGPCLTKDPFILAAAASQANLTHTLAQHGRDVNESMHDVVADSLVTQLRAIGKDPANADVLICGLAFKGQPETGDTRGSSALEIAQRLKGRVKTIYGHDPVLSADDIRALELTPAELPTGFANKDAVLILNNHLTYTRLDVFAMARALRPPGIVFDGWHLFRPDDVLGACPCIYMGLGFTRTSIPSMPATQNSSGDEDGKGR